jgi:hypothetical protein
MKKVMLRKLLKGREVPVKVEEPKKETKKKSKEGK